MDLAVVPHLACRKAKIGEHMRAGTARFFILLYISEEIKCFLKSFRFLPMFLQAVGLSSMHYRIGGDGNGMEILDIQGVLRFYTRRIERNVPKKLSRP